MSAHAAARPSVDVLPLIARAPYRWDFFAALRQLEAQHRDKPRLGTARRPADEPVRLGQAADLAFAVGSLDSVVWDGAGGRPRIQVRFFGLLGPNGPLPLHLTTFARERIIHRGDATFARFADLFHHRLLLLFYRAWAQAQPTASFDRPETDRFADYVGSFAGVGGTAWRRRDAAPDHARLGMAAVYARQVRNADGLEALLSRYLRRRVRVEAFAGRWMRLASQERSRLGRRGLARHAVGAALGAGAVLGGTVFDRQHHIRIHIGPLDAEAFESLLPVGRALPAVQALVDSYVGPELGWDLRLTLQPPARRPLRLGDGRGAAHRAKAGSGTAPPDGGAARLGWTTWLGRPRGDAAPAMTLQPRPVRTPGAPGSALA